VTRATTIDDRRSTIDDDRRARCVSERGEARRGEARGGANERATTMPVAAPALLVKLWIAKKLAVLLAVRAFGVKRLYRRGLKVSDYALGAPNATTTTGRAAARARWALRATCSAAMKTEKFFADKAFRYMDRVWAQAGFSSRGMPGMGTTSAPAVPAVPAVPAAKPPSTASSASAVAAREAAIAASLKKKDA
jgi:hypothetical protein